jgi:hypothetical protein
MLIKYGLKQPDDVDVIKDMKLYGYDQAKVGNCLKERLSMRRICDSI